jgi:hypothetical protein
MSSWVPLKDLKESHLLQVAEYALTNKILEGPTFAWWAWHGLHKRDRIIYKVKSRYWAWMHKYSILLPKSVKRHSILIESWGLTCGKRLLRRKCETVTVLLSSQKMVSHQLGIRRLIVTWFLMSR